MSNDIQLIEIPKWGLSMEEGTVNQWLINEGDSFQTGDELVEIESSKIVNVVEAHFSGTLRRILANAGETLSVATPIGVAADASVSDDRIDSFIASLDGVSAADPELTQEHSEQKKAQPESTAKATSVSGDTSVPTVLKEGGDDLGLHATLHARRLAKELGVNLHNVPTKRRNNRISRQDVEAAVITAGGSVASTVVTKSAKPSSSSKDDSQVTATPVARRLAKQLGVNLHDCRASGSRGRVSKADVEAASASSSDPLAMPEETTARTAVGCSPVNEATEFPMDGMRRTIAARLQESKQTAPHFRLVVDVTIDQLLATRKKLNAANPSVKVSINDFLLKASATALIQVPGCNIQFDGNTITRYRDADISVAVALDDGLITPIVKAANKKGLVEISNEVRALVTKAKTGTLTPDEFQGGTFSISNLGMFGVKQFDAIINPPQGAILAVGGGEQRMIVQNGEPTVATVLTLSLSSDHRAIDGALGAEFLQKLKWLVENPDMMLA